MCKSGQKHQSEARKSTLSEWIFAKFWVRTHRALEKKFRPMKEELFAGISGNVLEIGPGTGSNFQYYPKGVQLIGAEPNRYMHPYMKEAALAQGLELCIKDAYMEDLDVEDNSIDAVVSTLVLCSVDDPEKALVEITRMLKPGGKFYFIEHVAAPQNTLMRLTQKIVAPLWRKLADGCNPHRETWRTLEKAGFEKLDLQHGYYNTPFVLTNYLIFGKATK